MDLLLCVLSLDFMNKMSNLKLTFDYSYCFLLIVSLIWSSLMP